MVVLNYDYIIYLKAANQNFSYIFSLFFFLQLAYVFFKYLNLFNYWKWKFHLLVTLDYSICKNLLNEVYIYIFNF